MQSVTQLIGDVKNIADKHKVELVDLKLPYQGNKCYLDIFWVISNLIMDSSGKRPDAKALHLALKIIRQGNITMTSSKQMVKAASSGTAKITASTRNEVSEVIKLFLEVKKGQWFYNELLVQFNSWCKVHSIELKVKPTINDFLKFDNVSKHTAAGKTILTVSQARQGKTKVSTKNNTPAVTNRPVSKANTVMTVEEASNVGAVTRDLLYRARTGNALLSAIRSTDNPVLMDQMNSNVFMYVIDVITEEELLNRFNAVLKS